MSKAKTIDIITIVLFGFLAFGLQIPFLGFFQDDWNFVFFSSTKGAQGIFEFLIQDGRPGASWIYFLGFRLLQYHPAAWQLLSILLRISTAIVFWLILNKFWVGRRFGNLTLAILFLAYPFFTLQPLSVAYAPHLAAFLLYMLSIYFMIRAMESPANYVKYSTPAIIFTFIHLFTVEYFIGLEFLRPLVLWFLPSPNREAGLKKRLQHVLLNWLPYVISTLSFVIWRIIFISDLGIRRDPIIFISDPTKILSIIENIPADFVLMLINSWFNLIDPERFVIGPIRNLYILFITLIAGVVYYFIARQATRENEPRIKFSNGMIIGSIMTITGMAAAYVVGYIVHLKISPWNSRFALPALPGLAIIVLVTIETLVSSPKTRHIFFAIMIGLLIGSHNQNTFDFKSAWEKQERLYQQLTWRAPSIKTGTAIIANEEILGYMGDYPLSFAINALYGGGSGYYSPYWFFAISENFDYSIDNVLDNEELNSRRAFTLFHGRTDDAIFITYEPENGQCLWVLRPGTAEYKYLPTNMKQGALVSNINSISPESKDLPIYAQIVDEDQNNWCFYYQKAELARQVSNWQAIPSLWDEAGSRGLRPRNGFEVVPFIEGYAHIGKWEDAYLLTDRANRITNGMYFLLCPTWQDLADSTPSDLEKDIYVGKANEMLRCAVP
jgi:hypothetical protein